MDRFYGEPTSLGIGRSFGVMIEVDRIKKRLQKQPRLADMYKHKLKKGEDTMKIKFDKHELTKTNPNQSGKSFPICRVYGTALSGKLEGKEYTTQFFQSAKDMLSQVKELKSGDIVEIKMTANGQYWNPTSFSKVEDDGVPTMSTSTGSGGKVVQSNPRLDNLKVAVKIIGPKAKGKSSLDYLTEVSETVKLIEDFVDEKGAFMFKDGGVEPEIPEVEID